MSSKHQKIKLTNSQVKDFLDSIDVTLDGEQLSDLNQITARFMQLVPFQNLTMLIGPRRRPTWDEICNYRCNGER